MSRINQAALVDTINEILPKNMTWYMTGDVPEVLTESFFKSIKWLNKGQVIHGDEPSLPCPVSYDVFCLKYDKNLESLKFIQNRKTSYPNIADQLDMLWHAIDSNSLDKSSDFYLQVKAVKDKYPKPE